MIALSIALALSCLAGLWTVRDVVLRLHRGSEADEALRAAREAQEAVEARCGASEARVTEALATVERVEGEWRSVKAGLQFGGRR